MTSAERKKRFDALGRIGCIVCRAVHGVYTPNPHIHHMTGIKYRATGKKANDEHTLPLCHFHHQGAQGIHTLGTKEWERMFYPQDALLQTVNNLIEEVH